MQAYKIAIFDMLILFFFVVWNVQTIRLGET